jgi:molybdopterin/thiamine biosynthesis adenylyltransferase
VELIWPAGLRDEVRAQLLSAAPLEHGGAIFAVQDETRRDSRWLALSLELPEPQEVSVNRTAALEIDPRFWSRVAKKAARNQCAVIPVHTHPFQNGQPSFSATDRTGELRLLPFLERATSRSSAAVVVGQQSESVGDWTGPRDRAEGRCRDIRVGPDGGLAATQFEPDERFERQVRAFGQEGQRRISHLSVGVVGASGTGSHVCQQLIRLGVREIIVVDHDSVETVNLNRIVTAWARDAAKQRKKVATIKSYARLVGGTRVKALGGNVMDARVADRLRRVDALFACTDTLASRAVLNRIAIQHFIPLWDCGTEISPANEGLRAFARMRVVMAGAPCLYCMGVIDPQGLREELLPEADRNREESLGYISQRGVPAPSVVSINGIAASIIVTSFLKWAVGREPIQVGQWTYRVAQDDLRRQAVDRLPDCPVCSPSARLGRANLDVTL